MVSRKVIHKIVEDAVVFSHHISNDEIRVKVSEMTFDERVDALSDKTNPFEKEEYHHLTSELEFWEMIASEEREKGEDVDPNAKKQIKKIKDTLFEYDKRIIRGYDLNKNLDKVPPYDIKDYTEEKYDDGVDKNTTVGKFEQSQLDYQEQHLMVDDEYVLEDNEINSLRKYFGNQSPYINCELSPKYKNGLWGELPSDMRKQYHEANKEVIPSISSAIGKSPGLKENSILYHGVQDSHLIDIHTRVGDTVKLDSFISTSYDEHIGESYGEVTNSGTLYVRFLAPNGTKGICANDNNIPLTNWKGEHEYLLDRNQKGTVVDIDYDTGCVTVLLE